jgi:hypothetical protein
MGFVRSAFTRYTGARAPKSSCGYPIAPPGVPKEIYLPIYPMHPLSPEKTSRLTVCPSHLRLASAIRLLTDDRV